MDDYPPNSQKARTTAQPREKLERVTSAETVRRKRGLGRRFREAFIGGNMKEATVAAVEDVVLPGIRDTLFDAVQTTLEKWIFGESRRGRPTSSIPWTGSSSPLGRVDYAGYGQPTKPKTVSRGNRARHNFNDLVIPTIQEANEVLDRMFDIISRDQVVFVADLYEMTDIQSSHVDFKWGWTNLRGAKAVRLRTGGFLLDLPEPEPLG